MALYLSIGRVELLVRMMGEKPEDYEAEHEAQLEEARICIVGMDEAITVLTREKAELAKERDGIGEALYRTERMLAIRDAELRSAQCITAFEKRGMHLNGDDAWESCKVGSVVQVFVPTADLVWEWADAKVSYRDRVFVMVKTVAHEHEHTVFRFNRDRMRIGTPVEVLTGEAPGSARTGLLYDEDEEEASEENHESDAPGDPGVEQTYWDVCVVGEPCVIQDFEDDEWYEGKVHYVARENAGLVIVMVDGVKRGRFHLPAQYKDRIRRPLPPKIEPTKTDWDTCSVGDSCEVRTWEQGSWLPGVVHRANRAEGMIAVTVKNGPEAICIVPASAKGHLRLVQADEPVYVACSLPLAALAVDERCAKCGAKAGLHREWVRTQESRKIIR